MNRKSEQIKKSYDVVVIGGGLAGISASIAAARLGCKVALINDRPVLGGASSSESRVPVGGVNSTRYLAASAGVHEWFCHSRETGIIEELLLENRFQNPGNNPHLWDIILWEKVTVEPSIDLYLNTSAVKAEMESPSRISGVVAWQVSTFKEFLIKGSIFIDASGDGHIAYDAGAEYRMGRESKDEYNENIAPAKADTHTMGPSIYIEWRDLGRPVPFKAPKWAKKLSRADLLPMKTSIEGAAAEGRFHDAARLRIHNRGFWWIEYGGIGDTIADGEENRGELLKLAFGIWDMIQNYGEGAETLELNYISPIPGKRESRRFLGDYVLNQNDLQSGTLFPDRIAYGGRPIDLHPPGGIYAKYAPCEFVPLKALFSIPFRCICSRNIKNLMMAGRNISVTHVALGSTRLQAQCAIIGQAAGVAAYLCKKYNTTPRGIYEKYITELQQLLLKQDCYIPKLKNQDPKDFARQAKIRVSSSQPLEVTDRDVYDLNVFELDMPRGQIFLVTESKIESVHLLIESMRHEDTELTLGLRAAKSIYEFSTEKDVAKAKAVVLGTNVPQPVNQQPPIAASKRSWITFTFNQPVKPGYYWVWLPAMENLYWCGVSREPIGARRLVMEEGEWRPIKEWGSYCFKLTPPSKPYCGENVISGVARPEEETNIWISEPGLPQFVELDFGRPKTIDTIHLTFDSNLNKERGAGWTFQGGPVPECVRDYRVYCDVKGQWVKVIEEKGNYQRHRKHSFSPVSTRKVRLEVLATNGVDEARVYEIRCYREGEE